MQFVQHLMADRSACLYQLSKERDTVTLTQPPKDADRMIDVDERFEQRPQLRMYRAIAPGRSFSARCSRTHLTHSPSAYCRPPCPHVRQK